MPLAAVATALTNACRIWVNPGQAPSEHPTGDTMYQVFERCGTSLEWMYADAGSDIPLHRTLAEINPLRWTSGNVQSIVRDLEAPSRAGRPILMRTKGLEEKMPFNSAAEAVSWLKNTPAPSSVQALPAGQKAAPPTTRKCFKKKNGLSGLGRWPEYAIRFQSAESGQLGLCVYDNAADMDSKKDVNKTSIPDLTGATVIHTQPGAFNEQPYVESFVGAKYPKLTITGVPNVRGDTETNFCFDDVETRDQFATACVNLAAGREWDVTEDQAKAKLAADQEAALRTGDPPDLSRGTSVLKPLFYRHPVGQYEKNALAEGRLGDGLIEAQWCLLDGKFLQLPLSHPFRRVIDICAHLLPHFVNRLSPPWDSTRTFALSVWLLGCLPVCPCSTLCASRLCPTVESLHASWPVACGGSVSDMLTPALPAVFLACI